MFLSKAFCMGGVGYLDNVFLKEGRTIAEVTVINLPGCDEVHLEVEAQGLCQALLVYFFEYVKRGHSISFAFQAEYSRFEVAYPDTLPQKIDNHHVQVVKMSGKILEIGNCFMDGRLINKQLFHYQLAA